MYKDIKSIYSPLHKILRYKINTVTTNDITITIFIRLNTYSLKI